MFNNTEKGRRTVLRGKCQFAPPSDTRPILIAQSTSPEQNEASRFVELCGMKLVTVETRDLKTRLVMREDKVPGSKPHMPAAAVSCLSHRFRALTTLGGVLVCCPATRDSTVFHITSKIVQLNRQKLQVLLDGRCELVTRCRIDHSHSITGRNSSS